MNTKVRNTWFVVDEYDNIAKVYELFNGQYIMEVPGCMSRHRLLSQEEFSKLETKYWNVTGILKS